MDIRFTATTGCMQVDYSDNNANSRMNLIEDHLLALARLDGQLLTLGFR